MPTALGIVAFFLAAQAGSGPNPYLETGIEQVRQLQEKEALRTLEQARAWPDNSPQQLAQTHLWLGMAYAGLNQEKRAKQSFRTALILNPNLMLPGHPSPRVQRWWEEVRGKPAAEVTPAPTPPPAPTAPLAVPSEPPPTPSPAPTMAPPTTAQPEALTPPPTQISQKAHGGPGWMRATGWTFGAVGVASLAAGIFFGARMNSQANQAQREPNLQSAIALHDQAKQSASNANILFAAGGSATLLGAGLLAWSW